MSVFVRARARPTQNQSWTCGPTPYAWPTYEFAIPFSEAGPAAPDPAPESAKSEALDAAAPALLAAAAEAQAARAQASDATPPGPTFPLV